MAIIEGTAYWASLTRPNERFEPMWRIDLAVDSQSAEDLKGQGITVAETTVDEKTIPNIIRFKSGFYIDISVLSLIGMMISWYFLRYFR